MLWEICNVVYASAQTSVAFYGLCMAFLICQVKLVHRFMYVPTKINRQHLKELLLALVRT